MGLFGDLVRAAGSAAFEALDSALTAKYHVHWESEEDKAVFFKLMEKWDDFFSNLEISESVNFKHTSEKIFCAFDPTNVRNIEKPIYSYNNGSNCKFNFANADVGIKANEYDDYWTHCQLFYYEFTRNSTTFSIHSVFLGDEYMIQLKSSILEKDVAAFFKHADNYHNFNIRDIMKSLDLPELGDKIYSVTSKLKAIEKKRQEENQKKEEAAERAKREAEEKMRQEAEEKRIAEKKKETEALLSKLDEI